MTSLLWYRSQKDVQVFCKFGMNFTWTKNVEKSSYDDRNFSVIFRNKLSHGHDRGKRESIPVSLALETGALPLGHRDRPGIHGNISYGRKNNSTVQLQSW